MKKMISLVMIGLVLSGCSMFKLHKMDIVQGNAIEANDVRQLHKGMSQAQVKEIMGTPMLTNIFSPQRIDYVYTYQKGGQEMTEKKVTCIFQGGRLVDIVTTNVI
ncbi:MAG: outer membrane protein assembly factor BamE [Gammaproteobacteria bacterium]